MTDLIQQQLRSMILMTACGVTCGLIYHVVLQVRHLPVLQRLRAKSALADGLLEIFSLLLAGYCISVFLYYSDYGRIRLQDAVCLAAGAALWRKVYGKEGKPTPGVREESQGTGHQYCAGKPEKEKERKNRKR